MRLMAVDGKLYAHRKGDVVYSAEGFDIQRVFFIKDYTSDRSYMQPYYMPYSGRVKVTVKGCTRSESEQAQIVTAHYDVTKGDKYAYFTSSAKDPTIYYAGWTRWGDWSNRLRANSAANVAQVQKQPETTGTAEGGNAYIKIEYETVTGGV